MEKCRKCVVHAIKKCDAFGTYISFRMGDDLEYNSFIGGITTIVFGTVSLIYVIYNCIPFLLRKNVELIYTNKILMADPKLDLIKDHFTLAFGIQLAEDASAIYEDYKDYLDLVVNMRYWIGESDIVDIPMPLKLCDQADFYHETDETFEINEIEEYYCPNLAEWPEKYTLEGLYTDDVFIYMVLQIRIKDDVLQDEILLEELKENMDQDQLEMVIFFPDSAIDYESRDLPVPTYINYIYKAIEYNFVKKTETFIAILEFKNDENLLIDNTKEISDTILEKFSDSFYYIEDRKKVQNPLIGEFIVKASPKVIQVFRSYQKLASFIADLTSILEEILVLLLLVINFLERKAVDLKIIKKMLKYKGSKYYDVGYVITAFKKNQIEEKVNYDQNNMSRWKRMDDKEEAPPPIFPSNVLSPIQPLNEEENKEKEAENEPKAENEEKPEIALKEDLLVLPQNKKKQGKKKKRKNPIEKPTTQEVELATKNEGGDENQIRKDTGLPSENLDELNLERNFSRRKKKTALKNLDENPQQSSERKILPKKKKRTVLFTQDNLETEGKLKEEENVNKPVNIRQDITNNVPIVNPNDSHRNSIMGNENKENQPKEEIVSSSTEQRRKKAQIKAGTLLNFGVCCSLISQYCFCFGRRLRTRREFILHASQRIHYYLDIYTYIKKMQEIDIMKFCLFDDDQMTMFNFLSKPPITIRTGSLNSYTEFQKRQRNYEVLGKEDVDKLLLACQNVQNKKRHTFEDNKLISLVLAEVEFLNGGKLYQN
ncbi:MAG: hypothetical protein MJ252_15755 [archaeon]|nr:hypothetical protein [archaeon]